MVITEVCHFIQTCQLWKMSQTRWTGVFMVIATCMLLYSRNSWSVPPKQWLIQLIPKWPPFKYSFVYLQISPRCLVFKLEKGYFLLNEATGANLQVNKRTLKWRPFWNKVYAFINPEPFDVLFFSPINIQYSNGRYGWMITIFSRLFETWLEAKNRSGSGLMNALIIV